MSWRRYRNHYSRFAPYVSTAEKMLRAEKAAAALMKKKGASIEPISLDGHAIARTWWGKAWNENIERYSDFANRLPRGRSYVRNGSVLDLKIAANSITALVSGSRATPYKVAIKIKPLDKKVEQALMEKSRTSLDSMQALLSGKFPAELKESFIEKGTGLFPSPQEIEMSCSCPDWAAMCKHVAATLYGTAVRLDEKPELFFILRGIKIADFVGKMIKLESEKMLKKAKTRGARVIEAKDDDISKLFGIAMDAGKVPDDKPETVIAAPSSVTADKPVKKPKSPIKKHARKNKKLKKTTSRVRSRTGEYRDSYTAPGVVPARAAKPFQ